MSSPSQSQPARPPYAAHFAQDPAFPHLLQGPQGEHPQARPHHSGPFGRLAIQSPLTLPGLRDDPTATASPAGSEDQAGVEDSSGFKPVNCPTTLRGDEIVESLRHDDGTADTSIATIDTSTRPRSCKRTLPQVPCSAHRLPGQELRRSFMTRSTTTKKLGVAAQTASSVLVEPGTAPGRPS